MSDGKPQKMVENIGSTVVQGMKAWGQVDYVGADVSRWVVVYPHYIDSTRKQAEGRRIAKENCVDKPNAGEVFECVRRLGLRTLLEMDKAYCRDCWLRGRVRVELLDSSGVAVNESVASRQALFVKVASMIPQFRQMNANTKSSNAAKVSGAASKAQTTAVPSKKKKGKR